MTERAPTAHERQPFILCADDFAMTRGVSRGILSLLEAGRLSATSAMTGRPHWRDLAPALREHRLSADIGLHLNFTCGAPCAPMPLVAGSAVFPNLAQFGRLAASSGAARKEIAGEIERQLDAYEAVMGHAPDFVDGHQHVHVLPGVRRALLNALQRRYGRSAQQPYVRAPADYLASIRARRLFAAKAIVVRALATGFARMAQARGLAVNHGFAGFSDLTAERNYGQAFPTYLVRPGQRHLVMCHPGHVDDELRTLDPVLESRQNEFDFLIGEEFPALLAARHMRLGRFRDFPVQ